MNVNVDTCQGGKVVLWTYVGWVNVGLLSVGWIEVLEPKGLERRYIVEGILPHSTSPYLPSPANYNRKNKPKTALGKATQLNDLFGC